MRPTPHGHVRTIELVVVGRAKTDDGARAPTLGALEAWCSAFFAGCTVRVADDRLPLKRFAENAREGMEGQLQIKVGDVFDALDARTKQRGRVGRDVLFSVAVTMVDIYPGDGWNFVFGQARSGGPGVFSFARYYPGYSFPLPWTGADVAAGAYDASFDDAVRPLESDAARALMLRRSCKVLTHEIGHIFGIKHCIYYECLIAGANHLTEFDKRPLFLCPIDVRKLQHALGFDLSARARGSKGWPGMGRRRRWGPPPSALGAPGWGGRLYPKCPKHARRHASSSRLAGARASRARACGASQRGFVGASGGNAHGGWTSARTDSSERPAMSSSVS